MYSYSLDALNSKNKVNYRCVGLHTIISVNTGELNYIHKSFSQCEVQLVLRDSSHFLFGLGRDMGVDNVT